MVTFIWYDLIDDFVCRELIVYTSNMKRYVRQNMEDVD